MRTVVVLPAPFGPSRPSTVPVGISRSTLSSERVDPNVLTSASARTATWDADDDMSGLQCFGFRGIPDSPASVARESDKTLPISAGRVPYRGQPAGRGQVVGVGVARLDA